MVDTHRVRTERPLARHEAMRAAIGAQASFPAATLRPASARERATLDWLREVATRLDRPADRASGAVPAPGRE